MVVQLELFRTEEECEMMALRKEVNTLQTSLNKVRRGTYASIGEIRKDTDEVKQRLDILERFICRK